MRGQLGAQGKEGDRSSFPGWAQFCRDVQQCWEQHHLGSTFQTKLGAEPGPRHFIQTPGGNHNKQSTILGGPGHQLSVFGHNQAWLLNLLF